MLNYLRSEIDGSTYSLGNQLSGVLNDFAHSKVSNFDFSLLGEKNVLQFKISMDDAFFM